MNGSTDGKISAQLAHAWPNPTYQRGKSLPAKALLDRLKALNSNAIPGWADWLPTTCLEEFHPRGGHDPTYLWTADALTWPGPQTMGTYPPMPTLLAANYSYGNPQECEALSNGFQKTSHQISGLVWKLSQDEKKCRKVQEVFDDLAQKSDTQTLLHLADEMKGHVWEAVRCPHANHVLQKIIKVLPEHCGCESIQFVIDELLSKRPQYALQASRHKFACRIPQRLLEVCPAWQVEQLVKEILKDAKNLCTHQFGNYVIQHILDYGTEKQVHRILQVLQQNAAEVLATDAAYAVLKKGLENEKGSPEDKQALAQALIADDAAFSSMARNRFGHQVARKTRELLERSGV